MVEKSSANAGAGTLNKTKGKPRGRPRGSASKRAPSKKAELVAPVSMGSATAPTGTTALEKTPDIRDDFVLIEPPRVTPEVANEAAVEAPASKEATSSASATEKQPKEPRYTRSELSAYAREAVERLERRWQHRLKRRLGLWRHLLPAFIRQSPFGLSNSRRG